MVLSYFLPFSLWWRLEHGVPLQQYCCHFTQPFQNMPDTAIICWRLKDGSHSSKVAPTQDNPLKPCPTQPASAYLCAQLSVFVDAKPPNNMVMFPSTVMANACKRTSHSTVISHSGPFQFLRMGSSMFGAWCASIVNESDSERPALFL